MRAHPEIHPQAQDSHILRNSLLIYGASRLYALYVIVLGSEGSLNWMITGVGKFGFWSNACWGQLRGSIPEAR